MRQYRAQTIVGLRLVVLQGQGTLEFGDRFKVLEVLRRSPEQKSAGDMPFGQFRIQFKRAPAMKLGFLQPLARRVHLIMASGTHQRKTGMRQGKSGISRDCIA